MDLQVRFSARDPIENVPAFLWQVRSLATRLRLGWRPLSARDSDYRVGHGFLPLPLERKGQLSEAQRSHFRLHHLRGELYLTESGPLEDNPYYRWRVQMLERGGPDEPGVLEAEGVLLGIGAQVWALELMAVTLRYPTAGQVGPFLGGVSSGIAFSQQEVRTGLAGPLGHLLLVEFLAALRRTALPSLTVLDPSGYLESGDVLGLLEAMGAAQVTYAALLEALLGDPEDAVRAQNPEQALPLLEGEVGSPERLDALEGHLIAQRVRALPIRE